ncbi:methyltransferase [Haloechinothrix sp. LS1_15]|uniref:methyltransferase n=1 Tax=Haloechinothrix sp. LS1_15 TaxID=2652248 RepID=UPI00294ADC32|nr:methyltransferase [Haloechinothrix sp. LS1_15]
MPRTPRQPSLLEQLPPPLPASQIIALNQPKEDPRSWRRYTWHGWDFDVPPGVFLPGGTSRMFHDRLLDGTIEVRDRRYAIMGVGLGVEAVVAARRGARTVYAIDVHAESVAATTRHVQRLVGEQAAGVVVPVISDLFDSFPAGHRIDVLTFNPPAVSQRVSDDPDIVRNVCAGAPLLETFFAQLAERDLLAPGGEVYLLASTTADLRGIIGSAIEHGFTPAINHQHDWGGGVVTYLFRLWRDRDRE